MPKAEGLKIDFDSEININPDFLEVINVHFIDQLIKLQTKEFSAVCPFSGLPDVGILTIEYYPDSKLIIESKSLKYYLTSFRSVGIYQEKACNRIFTDLKKILFTENIKVTLQYLTRGGIDSICIEKSGDR